MSALGNSVAGIVWPWIVLERTGDPAAAGLVAAAVAVPSVLFAFLGGYLIDTVGRKPMSVISDIISGLSVAGVVLVDQTLGLTIAWFIILGIVGGVGDIPGMAARSALVGDIAQSSGKTVDYIAGLNQAIMGVSFLVGPALAGVLLASMESSWVLVITAACSFIAALLTTFLRLSKREMTEAEKAAAAEANALNLKALKSWGQVIRPPSIMMLAILTFVGVALVGPFLGVLMPAHFQNVDQPFLLGLAFSFYAIGMMVSGAGIAAVGTSRRRLVWVVAIGVEAIGFAMMAALGASWLVVIGCGIAGLAGGTADGSGYRRNPRAHARARLLTFYRHHAVRWSNRPGRRLRSTDCTVYLSAGRIARCRIHVGGYLGDDSRYPDSANLCCNRGNNHRRGGGFTRKRSIQLG
ncbi:major facilitator superfamily MFS_1 [Corynebacterium casei]|nr:major facilitator superfamily MFS_1 [Corynebacterium casei]